MFRLFLGHTIPVFKPPVEPVEELEFAEPFLKSVLKGIPVQKAANWHTVANEQLETADAIVNMIAENDSIDDIILDVEPESFDFGDDYQG